MIIRDQLWQSDNWWTQKDQNPPHERLDRQLSNPKKTTTTTTIRTTKEKKKRLRRQQKNGNLTISEEKKLKLINSQEPAALVA